jgi:adenosine deaminase
MPKAELHLHLEGTLLPHRVMALAQKYSIPLDWSEIHDSYNIRGFMQFLELYKWATSFLREPEDYAQLAQDAATELHSQGIIYAEITLSAGVMLLRKQDVRENLLAIRGAFERCEKSGTGPKTNFILDAVRQFGAGPAMEVARVAVDLAQEDVVAFGLGGDELSLPLADFRSAFAYAGENGLHLVCHAGETGGPEQIKDAIDVLHAERIGHGIAAYRSPALMNQLAERGIPLEICPTSNLRTGAIDIQLNAANAQLSHHPLPTLLRHGIPVTISTDDPSMFHTTLAEEYSACARMGLKLHELVMIQQTAFEHAFVRDELRRELKDQAFIPERIADPPEQQ